MTNKSIKVLLCSPCGKKVGGISGWTAHILKYYKTVDTAIELIQYYPESGDTYQDTPLIKRVVIGIKTYIPFLSSLRKELKSRKPDVVHFVSSASFGLIKDTLAMKISKKQNVKSVIHFRFGRIPELYQKRNWEQKLLHWVIQLADKTVVIDKLSYDTLREEGYKRVDLLPNPLVPAITEIIAKNKFVTREDRKLLFAGHVLITKGVFELIEACKEIPNIKLKIIGFVSDDMKEKLSERAGASSDEWLEILGEQDFETTIKEMLSAGVFVLPTYTEGFPNVIIESMACACPIVTTNVGAIPEMLDIEKGFNNAIVIEPQNVEQLKEAIIKMLDDREYAIQCGLNAQQRVNKLYSMPQVWKQMESIWVSLT